MLWDDDAEGGDSLCLVLMEREAAAAYSHDLAGEGETDSASFRLRGEERDENVGGYIFGDETGVVAHVDDDGFLGVGVGLETDKCLLACRGLQICGAAFLLVFSFLFPESFLLFFAFFVTFFCFKSKFSRLLPVKHGLFALPLYGFYDAFKFNKSLGETSISTSWLQSNAILFRNGST